MFVFICIYYLIHYPCCSALVNPSPVALYSLCAIHGRINEGHHYGILVSAPLAI